MGIGTLRRYHDNDEGRAAYEAAEAVASAPAVVTQSPTPVEAGAPVPIEQNAAQ